MTELKFKPGDIVCLKSGGPIMTVHEYKTTVLESPPKPIRSMVVCTWFDSKNTRMSDTFHEDQLELASDDDGYKFS